MCEVQTRTFTPILRYTLPNGFSFLILNQTKPYMKTYKTILGRTILCNEKRTRVLDYKKKVKTGFPTSFIYKAKKKRGNNNQFVISPCKIMVKQIIIYILKYCSVHSFIAKLPIIEKL